VVVFRTHGLFPDQLLSFGQNLQHIKLVTDVFDLSYPRRLLRNIEEGVRLG
jgi:hypothetical protein